MYRAVIVVVPLKYGYIPIPVLPSTRVAVLIVDVVDVDKATTEYSLVNEIGSTIEFQVLVDKLSFLPPWLPTSSEPRFEAIYIAIYCRFRFTSGITARTR